MRKGHAWTDSERELVRLEYDGTGASLATIGRKLGVSAFAVKGQVARLGLAKRVGWAMWSDHQTEQLHRLADLYCVTEVARRMGRSVNSVVCKMKRLGISRRSRLGWYTATDVCEILARDHRWIQARIDSGQLAASYHHGRKPPMAGSGFWHIESKDLREFIRRYPQELDGRNVDLITIVDILCGLQN